MAGEGVRDDIGGALPMYDGEIEVGEEFQPVGLALREVGLCVDVAHGPVVGNDSEVAALEVVAPEGEALDDGEELTLVVGVLELGGGVAGRVVGNDTFVRAGTLCEKCAGSELGGIGMESEGLGEVRGSENGGSGEGELEIVKGCDVGG